MRGMAAVLQRQQKFDEAETMLLTAIELQPGNWNNIDALGAHYFNTGQYSDAVNAYRRVVFLDPTNWRGLGNLGTALMLAGDFDAASGPLEESLSIEEDVDFLSNLGVIYYYLGQYDRAVELHRKALSEMPRSVSAWLNLGDALRFSSYPDEAASAYREASVLAAEEAIVAPNSADSLYLRAWALASLGNRDEAGTLIRQALSIAPRDPYADYFDALIKVSGGDQAGALDALERAVANGYPMVMLTADPLLSDLRYEQEFSTLFNR